MKVLGAIFILLLTNTAQAYHSRPPMPVQKDLLAMDIQLVCMPRTFAFVGENGGLGKSRYQAFQEALLALEHHRCLEEYFFKKVFMLRSDPSGRIHLAMESYQVYLNDLGHVATKGESRCERLTNRDEARQCRRSQAILRLHARTMAAVARELAELSEYPSDEMGKSRSLSEAFRLQNERLLARIQQLELELEVPTAETGT